MTSKQLTVIITAIIGGLSGSIAGVFGSGLLDGLFYGAITGGVIGYIFALAPRSLDEPSMAIESFSPAGFIGAPKMMNLDTGWIFLTFSGRLKTVVNL